MTESELKQELIHQKMNNLNQTALTILVIVFMIIIVSMSINHIKDNGQNQRTIDSLKEIQIKLENDCNKGKHDN